MAAAFAVALAASGCSVSFTGFLANDDDISTGSVTVRTPGALLSPDFSTEDWRRAAAALAIALDPQGDGASAGWSNPDSGLKGSISPVGSPFVKNDEVCRSFVATTVTTRGQDWVQGSACRPSGGEWAVRSAKPWKKPA
ncbi:MAG: RT0821/Lpp0805 family surface protein [Beijerinckiaceae bacterium]